MRKKIFNPDCSFQFITVKDSVYIPKKLNITCEMRPEKLKNKPAMFLIKIDNEYEIEITVIVKE
jgi:hypothetical protein